MEQQQTEIVLAAAACLRCGHQWTLRKPVRPLICPHCKSAYWDRPRIVDERGAAGDNGTEPSA